jgi:hypothetical protein
VFFSAASVGYLWGVRLPVVRHGSIVGLLLVSACQFDSSGHGSSLGSGSESSAGTEAVTTETGDAKASGSSTTPDGDTAGGSTGIAEGSTTTGQEQTEETGSVPASCDRALFVTGDPNVVNTPDAPLYARLLDLGFSVTVAYKPDSTSEDVADHCIIIISDVGSSTDVNTKFLEADVGVVILEPGLYDDMRLVAAAQDQWWGDDDGLITIVDPTHPLAAGLAGTIAIYEGNARGSWGIPVASAQVVAIWGGDPMRATLMGYETGVEMAHGFIAPARRVGFPGGVTPTPMTPERIELFEVAVRWAAGDLL